MRAPPLILACDVGGTRIKLGLVQGARVLARAELDARAGEGIRPALPRLVAAARRCCRAAGRRLSDLDGCGLSFPGLIEPRTARILSTPAGKFDDAGTFDVAAALSTLLGAPVRLVNDANAALAGEWRHGAARGARSAVMMTLGTGIGTSAIIDGVPLRGQHGQAGCLGGHFTLALTGPVCPCGNLGCGETVASTWALPAQARDHPGFAGSLLARAKPLDYAAVFQAAARRDPLACALRDHAVRAWSATLVSLIHAYDPEVVVVGGGIMRSRAVLLPRFRRHVARHAWTPWGRPALKCARLGDDAALLGVAALFQEA